MFQFIDNFLNRTTMYRLMLYFLTGLLFCALVFSFLGYINITPHFLILSAALIIFLCWIFNFIFAKAFNAPINVESAYISGFILTFLISPPSSFSDIFYLKIAIFASLFAMTSKYVLSIKKKHIFNPAAFGVFLTSILIGGYASWWVGNIYMVIPVILGGLLMAKKVTRIDFVFAFFVASLAVNILPHIQNGTETLLDVSKSFLFFGPVIFFAIVMLTEPLTTPPAKSMRILYGGLIGLLFYPVLSLGQYFVTPEIALLLGNVFSYIVSPKKRLVLTLREKNQIAADTYEFVFNSPEKLSFLPGQYLEWTLEHKRPDTRGNRRYFTIASSPTEDEFHIGIKFYPESSTFKKKLFSLEKGDKMVASELAGDFVMPDKKEKKLVFISGGIGVTPFRSIAKYLIDKDEKRDVIHFYSNKSFKDIAFAELFGEAEKKLKIKTIYTLTDKDTPKQWPGEKGFIDQNMIEKYVPDYKERVFYLSGPHAMVDAFNSLLRKMGVKRSNIKKDFFPGYV